MSDPLVRTTGVEIRRAVRLEHMLQVPLPQDDDVIKTLAPCTSQKSLARGVHRRRAGCGHEQLDASTLCDTIKGLPILLVAVADDDLRAMTEGRNVS